MMLALGMFAFSTGTAAYQELQRRSAWRHAQSARQQAIPASQFLGPEADTISLSGLILPGLSGKHSSIRTLREMGGTGDAHSVVTGTGEVLGDFVITSLSESGTIFMADGTPRKADFTIELMEVA